MRATSPAITTLLLMVVAVAGGMTVWQSMNFNASIASQSLNVDSLDVSLVKISGGNVLLSVTIKNSGTIYIDSIEAGFWDDNQRYSFLSGSDLAPGEQWSKTGTFDAKIEKYQRYAIKISARGSDDSTLNSVVTVSAE